MIRSIYPGDVPGKSVIFVTGRSIARMVRPTQSIIQARHVGEASVLFSLCENCLMIVQHLRMQTHVGG